MKKNKPLLLIWITLLFSMSNVSVAKEGELVKVGAWMQNEARLFFKGHPRTSEFLVRRARLGISGSFDGIFNYLLVGEMEGDNGTNVANLKDGYVEYAQFPTFQIRIGHFREPFGLENHSEIWIDFLERFSGDLFLRPVQDLGVMLHGQLFSKHLEYGIGLFNGNGPNTAENNEDKDIAARLVVRLFKEFYLGSSVTYGKQNSALDGSGPATTSATRFLTFVNPTAGTDVLFNDFRTRAGADLEWLIGPFALKSEYVINRFQNITFGTTTHNWVAHGFRFQTTYLLTGETKPRGRNSLDPKNPINPKEGKWGALEVGGKFESFWSDRTLIRAGFATGSDDLWSLTSGINWYLNKNVKLMGNYVFTKFDDPVAGVGNKSFEHALLFRAQFAL